MAVLAAHGGLGMVAAHVVAGPAIEPARLIARSLYLALMAILLVCLGAYEERAREEISRLASWPRTLPREAPALVRDLLGHTAALLGSPRVLMGWEEPEEPWFHLASWSRGEFHWNRQPPGTYEPLVAEPLTGADFLCPDARAAAPTCLHTSAAGLRRAEIYLIVHEALVNAARHAQASTARVGVAVQENQVRIHVTDDGRGFRFHGHYDQAALTDMKLGPVTLKERIAVLHGSLAIDSDESGAREVAGVLTPREIEIVRMGAAGLRNKEIADKLSISEGTVKIHLHHIYEKLHLNGRLELAAYAGEKGLI